MRGVGLPKIKMNKLRTGIGKITGITFVSICFVLFSIRVIRKVTSGKGLDYYLTGSGIKFNYIGALVVIIILSVTLPVSFYYGKQWKKREKEKLAKSNLRKKNKNKYKLTR